MRVATPAAPVLFTACGGSDIAVQPAATPTRPRRARANDPTHLFLTEFELDVRRVVRASRVIPRADHDDVVQAVLVKVWCRLEHYRAAYPTRAVLAKVLVRSVGEDHNRAQRSQQCQGARLVDDGRGGLRTGRQGVSLDGLVERAQAGGYNEVTAVTLRDGFDPVGDSVIDRLGACQRVEQVAVQLRLSQRDRALVHLVDGLGLTVTQAARHIGVARETANRRLTQIHRSVEVLGPDNFAVA